MLPKSQLPKWLVRVKVLCAPAEIYAHLVGGGYQCQVLVAVIVLLLQFVVFLFRVATR